MRFIKYQLSFLLSTIFVFSQSGYGQEALSEKDLPNFYQVNSSFYRGGQPTETGVKELAEMGVKTIIYLRGADEKARAEEKWARDAGIKFINVPMNNWTRPKNAQIEKILNLINASENQPVFIHCKRGKDRTGTIVAVYRISRDGWTAKRAKQEAEKKGFGWWQFWMKDYIDDYYRDFKKSH